MTSHQAEQGRRRHFANLTRGHGPGRAAVLVAALAVASLAASACSSSGSPSSNATGSAAHPVTLVVLDGDGGETGLLAAYAALNKQFEAAHPGVKIDFVVKSFSDLLATLKLQLSGSTGVPAVTQDNEGYQSLGELVTDGLVKNLDSISSADNWSQRQPASLLALDGEFSSNGKTMGSGSLWGISATGTWVGLFENTALATKLGITSAPQTFSQLEQDLATAKAHGVLPLQYGTNDISEDSWLLGEILMAETSPQLVANIVDAASTTLPTAITNAAKTLQAWQNDGYLTPGSAAYSSSDVFTNFLAGKGLFVLSGSWSVPLPGSPASTAKFRMIPFPLAQAGETGAIASGDLPWSIPTKSPYPQLAAEYINFITSPAANAAWLANGQVPATVSTNEMQEADSSHLSGASMDAATGWLALLKSGATEPYLDWSTPTFLNTLGSASQSLVAGKTTPQGFTAALQADYGPFASQRRS
jgi:raffinose/stachyose/melibiose transport system substrate-binding protein